MWSILVLTTFNLNSQNRDTINVNGACGMCKERIENAALNIIGVFSAVWDVETHLLTVEVDSILYNDNELHTKMASIGHDTDKIKASDEIYNNLHGCCQYRGLENDHSDNNDSHEGHIHEKGELHTGTSEDPQLRGYIYTYGEEGEEVPLIGATTYWLDDKKSAITDLDGFFEIERRLNEYLVVSYVGFDDDTIMIDQKNQDIRILISDNVTLDGVEVSHNRSSAQISFTEPLKVLKISEKELCKAACCNLSESFSTIPSVDVSTTDAITGTRKIEMLGLAGPYVQITKENMPYARGLASVGGLTYIPGLWVDGMMLNQGSGSVVNGYESMAGQINVELKKTDHSDKLFLNGYFNTAQRAEFNLTTNRSLNDKWSTALLMHGARHQYNHDNNGDGFLDMPKFNILALTNRWKYLSGDNIMGQIGIEAYWHDAVAGQVDFDPKTSNRTEVWGNETNTKRFAFWTKRGIILDAETNRSIGLQFSTSYQDEEEIFGLKPYKANQTSFYFNSIFQTDFIKENNLMKMGLNGTYDKIEESVEIGDFERDEWVFGAFTEHTFTKGDIWTVVSGIRIDHHNQYGWFATPRIHLRYAPAETTVFRFHIGMGRRTPNVFSDNKGYFASNRQFVLRSEDVDTPYGLEQEISKGLGASITKVFQLFGDDATFSVEANYIEFDNQAVVDVDASTNEVAIYNLQEESFTKSVQTQLDFSLTSRIKTRLAYRYLDVQTDFQTGRLAKPFTSEHRAFTNLEIDFGNGWSFDYTLNWQGKQRLPNTLNNPEQFRLDEYSSDYYVSNVHITKSWNNLLDVYIGGENIFDRKLDNPIVDAQNPFSQYFDASMVWGPVFGRNVYVGFRYKLKN